MNCFMFPGQPFERPGQLPDDPDFRDIADMALRRTSLDLQTFSWTGQEWTESVKLQVYGVAMSLYRARRLREEGVMPELIAEHSMGIYAALSASGALSEEEALELGFRIGCATTMLEGEYAVGCIIGLTLGPVLSVAENNGVYLANHNTSRHFLLSGERNSIEQAVAEATDCGAFSARTFPSDAPLHTPLMEEAAAEIRSILACYQYRQPAVPLINHIDQNFLSAADMADFMLREMLLPVYWEKTYLAIEAAGATCCYEVGVGDSLKKFNRWIDSQL